MEEGYRKLVHSLVQKISRKNTDTCPPWSSHQETVWGSPYCSDWIGRKTRVRHLLMLPWNPSSCSSMPWGLAIPSSWCGTGTSPPGRLLAMIGLVCCPWRWWSTADHCGSGFCEFSQEKWFQKAYSLYTMSPFILSDWLAPASEVP